MDTVLECVCVCVCVFPLHERRRLQWLIKLRHSCLLDLGLDSALPHAAAAVFYAVFARVCPSRRAHKSWLGESKRERERERDKRVLHCISK